MSEHEIIKKIKDKQGILSKIQNFFTLGYGTKEDLRELDKKLRDLYYMDLREMRHTWEDIYLSVLDAEIKVSSRNLKKILQTLDIIMEKIHRADYGYAGLLDRKGHIREEELARIFKYDEALSKYIENVGEAINITLNDVESEKLQDVSTDVKKVKRLLRALVDKWHEREKEFKPLEI